MVSSTLFIVFNILCSLFLHCFIYLFILQYVPPDLCICNFVLEQSLSVRALQEMLTNTGDNASEGVSKLTSKNVKFLNMIFLISSLVPEFSKWGNLCDSRLFSFSIFLAKLILHCHNNVIFFNMTLRNRCS